MSHLDSGLIHELLDGEIPSSQLAPIQAHLAACAECRAKLAEERALVDSTDELIALVEVPESTPATPAERAVRPRRSTWPRDLAWAATVVIAAGLGYAVRGRPGTTVLHDTVTVGARPDIANDRPAASADLTQPSVHARPPISASTRQRAVTPPVPEPMQVAAAEKAAAPAPPPAVVSSVAGQRGDSVAATVTHGVDAAPPVAAAANGSVARDAVSTKQTIAAAPPPAPAKDSAARIDSGRTLAAETRSFSAFTSARGGGGGGGRGGGRGAPIDSISLADAMKHLGGKIMRIDSLMPVRYQVQAQYVYVLYAGGIRLRQQLVDGVIHVDVFAPGASADSLEKLRAKVHE